MKHSNGISDISLHPVENGFTLSYYQQIKNPGRGKFDMMNTERKEEVFKDNELQKAMDRMMELMGKKKESKDEEEPETGTEHKSIED